MPVINCPKPMDYNCQKVILIGLILREIFNLENTVVAAVA